MPLVPLYGHTALRTRLLDALRRGTLPQSLLLHGDAGIGKQRLAIWLATALVCERSDAPCGECRHCRMAGDLTHPDLLWIFPRPRLKDSDASPDDIRNDLIDGTVERMEQHGLYPAPPGSDGIFVQTVRMMLRHAGRTPALARRKVVIIGEAERMVPQEGSDQAANAFLKLLEEPYPNTFLILTTSTPGGLLPTVRSRVAAIRVAPLPRDDVRQFLGDTRVRAFLDAQNLPGDDDQRADMAAGAPGRLFAASTSSLHLDAARRFIEVAASGDLEQIAKLAMAQGRAGARGVFADFLEAIETQLRARMKRDIERADDAGARGAAMAVESLEDAKQLAYNNVNPQLIVASLLATLSDTFATARRG